MGKIKNDYSDNQMDIQENNAMQIQKGQKSLKKNKKILKTKSIPHAHPKSSTTSTSSHLLSKISKSVNLKQTPHTLIQKQQIFHKIIKGLNNKQQSKKQKRKTRVIMRRQLKKALTREDKQTKQVKEEKMEVEKVINIKKKKQPLNEKQQYLKVKSNMGNSISALKNMLVQRQQ